MKQRWLRTALVTLLAAVVAFAFPMSDRKARASETVVLYDGNGEIDADTLNITNAIYEAKPGMDLIVVMEFIGSTEIFSEHPDLGPGWGIGGVCLGGDWCVDSNFQAIIPADTVLEDGLQLEYRWSVDDIRNAAYGDIQVNRYNGFDIVYIAIGDIKITEEDEVDGYNIDETFPDKVLRAYVKENYDLNDSGILCDKEIKRAEELYIGYDSETDDEKVSDITGIDIFSSLTTLDVSNLGLTTLDVSVFPELWSLNCNNNALASIDVSKNPKLYRLYCYDNQLTQLDVSNNERLFWLDCSDNNLTELNVEHNSSLTLLECNYNQIRELNVSNCFALNSLSCTYNCIEELELDMTPSLEWLYCSYNDISQLTLTQNTNLVLLYCTGNPLNALDIAGLDSLRMLSCTETCLEELDVSNCSLLNDLVTSTEPGQYFQFKESSSEPDYYMSYSDIGDGSNAVYIYADCGTCLISDPQQDYATIILDLKGGTGKTFTTIRKGFVPSKPEEPTKEGFLFRGWYRDANLTEKYYFAEDNGDKEDSVVNDDMVLYAKWVEGGEGVGTDLEELFPDESLREHVKQFDLNEDGKLSAGEIDAVEEIHLSDEAAQNCLDITGLEIFTELEKLYLYELPIAALDTSSFKKLRVLEISECNIAALDLTANTKLERLYFRGEVEKTIRWGQNTALEDLDVNNLAVKVLDVGKFTNLRDLACNYCGTLEEIVFKNNTSLEHLECYSCNIKELNLSGLPNLQTLYCSTNHLKQLDISANTKLTDLSCTDNELDSLNVSANGKLELLWCYGNAIAEIDLTGVKGLINALKGKEREDLYYAGSHVYPSRAYSYSGSSLIVDQATVLVPELTEADYTEEELQLISMFPDSQFRSFVLKGYDYDDDNMLSEEELQLIAQETEIEVIDEIEDLTGIQYFTNLEVLKVGNLGWGNNKIKALDLSKNTKLRVLDCSGNLLTKLDLSKNSMLEELNCSENALKTLDVSSCKGLKALICCDNQLTELDVSKCPSLEVLACTINQITALDVTVNTELQKLICGGGYQYETGNVIGNWNDGNLIEVLDLSNNTKLVTLNCSYNQLTELDVTSCPLLEDLACSGNQISNLDVSKNMQLVYLGCHSNMIDTLNVGNLTKLRALYCADNKLSKLDVTQNTQLQQLSCGTNLLSEIDISHNRILWELRIDYTDIDTVDVSNNPFLNETIINADPKQLDHPDYPVIWINDEDGMISFDNGTVFITTISPETCTVTFDVDGGSEVAAQTVKYGTAAEKPSDPVWNAHTFEGWFTDEEFTEEFDFSKRISKDVTIYAKWSMIYTLIASGTDVEDPNETGSETGTIDNTMEQGGEDFVIIIDNQDETQESADALEDVYLDDRKLVRDEEYFVTVGCTIITFSPDVLKELSVGVHTIDVVFTDGSLTTELEVVEAEDKPEEPEVTPIPDPEDEPEEPDVTPIPDPEDEPEVPDVTPVPDPEDEPEVPEPTEETGKNTEEPTEAGGSSEEGSVTPTASPTPTNAPTATPTVEPQPDDNPRTGDGNQMMLWMLIAMLAILGAGSVLVYKSEAGKAGNE